MEIRWMKSFVAVAEELNYGRAAEVLHIAQPAVSQQVQQLEKRLGVKLFDRTTRSVRLTAAGERFLQPCKDALAGIDRAVDAAVIADPAVEGRVRVGFSGAYGQTELSSLARSVRRRYPLIDLVLEGATVSGQILDEIWEGQLDLGIVSDAVSHPHVLTRQISVEYLSALLPSDHPLADRKSIDLAELRDETFVANPAATGSTLRRDLLAACRDAGYTPNIVQETTDGIVLTALVAAGVGVALVPGDVQTYPNRVVLVPLDTGRYEVRAALAWSDRPVSPVVQTVLDLAAEVLPSPDAVLDEQ
ncbi:LysR family transcriptional regulator [Rhodococcus wratislaviensis]|uniref:LysR family transcriptional regulator n=1 Tax=Rhodococcus wratislaviensis TaxID=44752 RepID=UPI003660D150